MSKRIVIYIDPDPGMTLKLLYDICVFAEENYKELHGIRPLQRVEAGLGFPKHTGDQETYYKATLYIGWNRGRSCMQYCTWNLWIPDNWEDELPKHRLFHAGINNKRPVPTKKPESTSMKESYQAFLDYKSKAWDTADAFAHCRGKGVDIRKNKVIITFDCDDMPSKMFNAFKDALHQMGLCNKSGFETQSLKAKRKYRQILSCDEEEEEYGGGANVQVNFAEHEVIYKEWLHENDKVSSPQDALLYFQWRMNKKRDMSVIEDRGRLHEYALALHRFSSKIIEPTAEDQEYMYAMYGVPTNRINTSQTCM